MAAFLRRHVLAVSLLGVLAVAGVAFVAVWFQPQQLFLDKTVRETLPPEAVASPAVSSSGSPGPVATVLARSAFRSRAHHAAGDVRVIRQANGERILRIENLDVENGPDLYVTLAEAAADAPNGAFDSAYVSLGRLKGNKGDQTYAIPADVDLSRYASVAIWCERFSSLFGAAPLR